VAVKDGLNFLTTTEKQYDLIVLDIVHPMSAGAGTVFSREYYELCRRHLRPGRAGGGEGEGGIVCQWLPAHQLPTADLKTLVRTFQAVFPHTTVWWGLFGDGTKVVGCVGSERPLTIDTGRLAARYALLPGEARASLEAVGLGTPALLVSHFVLGEEGVRAFAGAGPVATDDWPVTEFTTPMASIPSGRQGSLNFLAIEAFASPLEAVVRNEFNGVEAGGIARAAAGKKALLEGIRRGVEGSGEDQRAYYREALGRDPENVDLKLAAPKESP
jgi:spermidine synthase